VGDSLRPCAPTVFVVEICNTDPGGVKLAGLARLAGSAVGGGTCAASASGAAVPGRSDQSGMSAVRTVAAVAAGTPGGDGAAVYGRGVAAVAAVVTGRDCAIGE
jgi:hypothetical protein